MSTDPRTPSATAPVRLELGVIDRVGRPHGFTRVCDSPDDAAETIRGFIISHEHIGSRVAYIRVDGTPIEVARCRR